MENLTVLTVSSQATKFIPPQIIEVLQTPGFFIDAKGILERMEEVFNAIPKTHETDETETEEKTVYLHYFAGSMDFYIVEQDCEEEQLQAFGYVQNGDCSEWDYINIEELKSIDLVSLDLFFTPKKFKEIVM
jgi:hypothetical protein